MNDPAAQPIDIEEQRQWLLEHKKATGLSWKQLSGRTGISHSTLSLWTGNNYNAPGDRMAAAVFKYRQTLASQAALAGETPQIPSYFETETSTRLIAMFNWAQRGRVIAAALSPGLGKTVTAEHYRACNANVFMVTATPATASLTGMLSAVLRALGSPAAINSNQSHVVSQAIQDRVRDLGNPLLIVDEAQHLSERSIEQIRSWHDATNLGVALLGNAGLLQTLEGGTRSIARAQLFSRVSMKHPQTAPYSADIEAMLDAWPIAEPKVREFVHTIAMKPGGLRGATFAIELAHMIAAASREELAVTHVQDAWAQLSTRPVAA
jgi:DNA transposition AAA+ family ATPase